MKVPKAGGAVVTLASGLTNSALAIAVFGNYIYWAESSYQGYGAIRMMPVNGGAVTTIASNSTMGIFNGIRGLAVDSSGIYWAECGNGWSANGSIRKLGGVPVDNPILLSLTAPVTLATTLAVSQGLAIDGSSVYWVQIDYANGLASSVAKVAKSGGGVTILASNLGELHGMAVDSTNAYFGIWNDYVYRVPKNGGTVTRIGGAVSSDYIALDDNYVYSASVWSSGQIWKTPKAGGGGTTWSSGGNGSWGVAADQSGVYWTECPTCFPAGGFIRVVRNVTPSAPINLTQLKSDETTEIPVGGTTNEPTVVFKASTRTLPPPGWIEIPPNKSSNVFGMSLAGDRVKLQIELRRLDEYNGQFLNTFTQESDLVDSGSQATITVYGLINGDYHWQARTVDEHDACSPWVQFGGNNISDSDFIVNAITEPTQSWSKVSSPDGVWRLRKLPGTGKDDVLMMVPNDWVLKVLSKTDVLGNSVEQDGYIWWNVESPGNDVRGWMAAENINESKKYLIPASPLLLQNIEELSPSNDPDEEAETAFEILKDIEDYYINNDITQSLYSSNDSDNHLSLFNDTAFPEEFILSIAAQESGGTWGRVGGTGGEALFTKFNNELKTWDGGYGIMQITTPSYKGKGSGLKVFDESCVEFRQVCLKIDAGDCVKWDPEYLCNWYTNTPQGIYANIKDGLRALQEKYEWSSKVSWKGESITCNNSLMEITPDDFKKIVAIWAYNGLSTDPSRNYLRDVSEKLASLESYFGQDYSENISVALSNEQIQNWVCKLNWVNNHRNAIQKIALGSPGQLRIFDSMGNVTGLVNDSILQEIPNSIYGSDENSVTLLFASDSYLYEVVGKEHGVYHLIISSDENGEIITFNAVDIPISPNAVHRYDVNAQTLSAGQEGVILDIDNDGDGVFENTVIADGELTHDEFVLLTETVIDFDPDTINVRSKGQFVTAYIELPSGFDANKIDISSILLNNSVPALSKPVAIGDHDKDGTADLMVKFERNKVQSIIGTGREALINITGKISHNGSRLDFKGDDTIKIVR
jgi:hypothetical protein